MLKLQQSKGYTNRSLQTSDEIEKGRAAHLKKAIRSDAGVTIRSGSVGKLAYKQLKEKADEINLPVDVRTIHSLLSLKMKWESGKQILVKSTKDEDEFNEYDYVVIDECSMLDSELMEYIRAAQYGSTKIIFMGDPCQLPPIGEKESESLLCGLEFGQGATADTFEAGEGPSSGGYVGGV